MTNLSNKREIFQSQQPKLKPNVYKAKHSFGKRVKFATDIPLKHNKQRTKIILFHATRQNPSLNFLQEKSGAMLLPWESGFAPQSLPLQNIINALRCRATDVCLYTISDIFQQNLLKTPCIYKMPNIRSR